ncbi:MAG: agmatine deiminase family protein [Leptospirales bacterium]|nr:agmatine deiminase family protein [Leptospirales bacterium]
MNEHGYRWPAEWEEHQCTIISWPLRPELWSGRYAEVRTLCSRLAADILASEALWILCPNSEQQRISHELRQAAQTDQFQERLQFLNHPTNDVWARDYAPLRLIAESRLPLSLDFRFNAWGTKFEPYDDDDRAGLAIASALGDQCRSLPQIVEGGAIETDGAGLLLSTESVLLNENRHPAARRSDFEALFDLEFGLNVIWLPCGLPGDDTDGHIDMFARFTAPRRVLLAQAPQDHPAAAALELARKILESHRFTDGGALELDFLPMPAPAFENGRLLPLTHANFYICNESVLAPVFGGKSDEVALQILERHFPGRRITPIACRDLFLEGGGIHCLTMQAAAATSSRC